MPLRYIGIAKTAANRWRAFLRIRYSGDFALYKREHPGTTATGFDSLPMPTTFPGDNPIGANWGEWVETDPPYDAMHLSTPEIRFRDWLASRYGSVQQLNSAIGTHFASFEAITLSYLEEILDYLKSHHKEARWYFFSRNYQQVFNYLVVRGRAFFNTFVLVVGTIFLALTVNPMAAFALSRFKLKSTYKILIFLLATMAFPAEVSAIPGFLLIKRLHLLNTFWALLLPGMAAGYSIFLLKGFFDSLPKEFYEAAEIDGATDWQLFSRICMPMSKPVLAVIALGSFGAAYGSFMWAFIVCQKKTMWTLMVWIQQLSLPVQQPTMFAALVLAAIPTLLVFIFCQNIIMRGIILPMEK